MKCFERKDIKFSFLAIISSSGKRGDYSTTIPSIKKTLNLYIKKEWKCVLRYFFNFKGGVGGILGMAVPGTPTLTY